MGRRVVAVVGASSDRRKFGNRAVRAFVSQGYDVKPVNPNERTIEGLTSYPTIADVPGPVDVVSVYVPPEVGIGLLDGIAARKPAELWINPGAESAPLLERARTLGLAPIVACSMIGLADDRE
jgi:predicted CoA-binding protein